MTIASVPTVKNPFPTIPGARVNRTSGRRQRWTQMSEVFCSGERPSTFEEVFKLCQVGCGQYEMEARAIWDFIQSENIQSIGEVGRNLGGTAFLMACAARNLKRFISQDIAWWALTDEVIPIWMNHHGIDCKLIVSDSMTYEHPEGWDRDDWDLVYIDGGHTGEIVTADILNWKDRTRFIGFHDYADRGRKNCHRRAFKGVVDAITKAKNDYGWEQAAPRGRSDIIFRTSRA